VNVVTIKHSKNFKEKKTSNDKTKKHNDKQEKYQKQES